MQISSIKNTSFGLTYTDYMKWFLKLSKEAVKKQGEEESDTWLKSEKELKGLLPDDTYELQHNSYDNKITLNYWYSDDWCDIIPLIKFEKNEILDNKNMNSLISRLKQVIK